MFKSVKNDGRLAELEQAVATAAAALVETKAATRVTWDKVKDLRAAPRGCPRQPRTGRWVERGVMGAP